MYRRLRNKFDTINAKGLKTMLHKNIIILVSFVLLAVLLSFSVTASCEAYANSSYAYALASGNGSVNISASATILNLISSDGEVEQGYVCYVEANAYSGHLVNLQLHPVLSSRAGAWNGYIERSAYWSN